MKEDNHMTPAEEVRAMASGIMPEEATEPEDVQASSDEIEDETAGTNTEDTSVEEVENNEGSEALEDTENQVTEEAEADTEGEEVAQSQETEEATDEVGTEDTQVDEVEKKADEVEVDETATKDMSEDYKAKYEELQAQYDSVKAFQDKVTGDFKANGKTVKGITDADKIVKNLQMSTGLTDKLAGYKAVKPVEKALKDRGLLNNPDEFNMLMGLQDRDPEAIRQYLSNANIDPMELELEGVNYVAPDTTTAPIALMFEETQSIAENYGVGDKFSNTILNEWDEDSVSIMFRDEATAKTMSNQLAMQMDNGIYDRVIAQAENMKLTDYAFRGLNSYEQYQEASKVINAEEGAKAQAQEQERIAEQARITEQAERLAKVEAEKARLAEEKQKAEYATKVEAERKKVAAQRDKAVAASTITTSPATTVKADKKLSAEDLRAQFRQMMSA